jgi:hypothetical protein
VRPSRSAEPLVVSFLLKGKALGLTDELGFLQRRAGVGDWHRQLDELLFDHQSLVLLILRVEHCDFVGFSKERQLFEILLD